MKCSVKESPHVHGVVRLDPQRVKPFAGQPRKRFRGIAKLAESIRAIGQVTPIIVIPCEDSGYDAELVDGERRLRACLSGGMKVRAVFEPSSHERFARSVAANFCRQDHDAVEIMRAVIALKKAGKTGEQIGSIFGKTQSWVSQYASLENLHPRVRDQLKHPERSKKKQRERGRVSLSVALLLVPLPRDAQVEAMRKIRSARMGMAQARTFVHRLSGARGVAVGKHQSDVGKFKTIESAVHNCRHVVDRYLDMPGVDVANLIRAAKRSERNSLAKLLEELCESLLMFADALVKE